MQYNDNDYAGRTLQEASNATFLMSFEKAYPGFLNGWEKLKERIIKSDTFERKDEHALLVYCALYVNFIYELGIERRFEDFESYFYILIAIQTKVKNAYSTFDDMNVIDSVAEKSEDECTNELLNLTRNINRTIKTAWGKTGRRVESLIIPENVAELVALNEKVSEAECDFLEKTDALFCEKDDFTLDEALQGLKASFSVYDEALTKLETVHKKLALSERTAVNSPENCCRYAIETVLKADEAPDGYVAVIFSNGTTVYGCEKDVDFEVIKEKAKKSVEEVYESVDVFVEEESDDEMLMVLTRIGYGVCNYYMQRKCCYFDFDEELARENRKRDAESSEIRYITYNGKVIFDSEK